MYSGLELVEYNPDPVKSEVMTRAAELRDEGYNRSDALSMAWDDILSDDYAEEDEDEFDYDDIIGINKPTRRKTMDNPMDEISAGAVMLIGGLGFLLWCTIAWKRSGIWSWQPWNTAAVVQKRLAARTVVRPPSDNGLENEKLVLIVP